MDFIREKWYNWIWYNLKLAEQEERLTNERYDGVEEKWRTVILM